MTTLVKQLIKWAVQIGRWLIEHAAAKGLSRLAGFMDGKIEAFKRRLARARTDRRKAWLTGRISRWTKALAWLIAHGPELSADALAAVCKLPAAQRLPMVARQELCPA